MHILVIKSGEIETGLLINPKIANISGDKKIIIEKKLLHILSL